MTSQGADPLLGDEYYQRAQADAVYEASKDAKLTHEGAYCHIYKPLTGEQKTIRKLRT
jgi:hypothetical protein